MPPVEEFSYLSLFRHIVLLYWLKVQTFQQNVDKALLCSSWQVERVLIYVLQKSRTKWDLTSWHADEELYFSASASGNFSVKLPREGGRVNYKSCHTFVYLTEYVLSRVPSPTNK